MGAIIPAADELEQLRQTTRRFMREEVRPAEEKVEHDAYQLPPELLNPLRAKAKGVPASG
jgi:acyl-CoA dehydrogenase